MDVSPIQQLSDLQLCLLVCILANEHAIIQCPTASLSKTAQTIQHTVTSTFHQPSAVVVKCRGPETTLESFAEAVLSASASASPTASHVVADPRDAERDRSGSVSSSGLDERRVAGFVVVVGLEDCVRDVQIMALELMRTRRIVTRHAQHTAPKRFSLVALVDAASAGPPFLTAHLVRLSSLQTPRTDIQKLTEAQNDQIFLSHSHSHSPDPPISPEDPDADADIDDSTEGEVLPPLLIEKLHQLHQKVHTTAQMRRYMHNIPTHLRLHAAVRATSVSALSTRHLAKLAGVLAALHGVGYVAPGVVRLAARKVYAHRVVLDLVDAGGAQRWGAGGVEGGLAVLDEVLARVECPL